LIVVRELTARFSRARAEHAAAGRPGGVEVFDDPIAWMKLNGLTSDANSRKRVTVNGSVIETHSSLSVVDVASMS